MTAVVVNHLHFSVPVDQIAEPVRREAPAVFDSCPGFRAFYFVKTADDRATAVIVWDSPEHAQQGAAKIGPGLFAQYLAPYLASDQQRSVGQAIIEHSR